MKSKFGSAYHILWISFIYILQARLRWCGLRELWTQSERLKPNVHKLMFQRKGVDAKGSQSDLSQTTPEIMRPDLKYGQPK